MDYDIKSSPAHILTIQEAEQSLLTHLRAPSQPGIRTHGDGPETSTHGGGDRVRDSGWTRRPCSEWWGIRGLEKDNAKTVMICARRSLCTGMRLLLFIRSADGEYKVKKGESGKDENSNHQTHGCFLQDEVFPPHRSHRRL